MLDLRKMLVSTGVYIILFLMGLVVYKFSVPILIFVGIVISVQLFHILLSNSEIPSEGLLCYRGITDNVLLLLSLIIPGLWSSMVLGVFSVYLICFVFLRHTYLVHWV